MTLRELETRFPTEDSCREYLVSLRWPEGVRCPRCGNEKVHKLAKPFRWQCKGCNKAGYRFSPLVGTIFENTNIPLRTWFQTILLMCQSKKGISALQIQRTLGLGSYRSAWYMCHRIRAAMRSPEFRRLTGMVEVDETYIGGKLKNMHPGKRRRVRRERRRLGKTAVVGAMARKGNVVAKVVQNTSRATLERFVRRTVDEKVSTVVSDEARGYRYINRLGYKHEAVSHEKGEYVRGNVHTGNLDSFWSLLKRGVVGTFHQVSAEYLPLYLNEFSFRYNNRKNPAIFEAVVKSA